MMKQGSKPKYDPQKHHRKSIRLSGYDYSQAGAYFITIVTYQRECLFGEIIDGGMMLNDFGRIADECWCAIPDHFDHADVGAYVIMPNHVHGIVIINTAVGAQHATPLRRVPQSSPNVIPGSLGAIVRSYKSAVTKQINALRNTPARKCWQRNYYERIIRDEREMDAFWRYTESNPLNWDADSENLRNI